VSTKQTCEYLEWDSTFFQRRVARVSVSSLSEPILSDVLGWCERERIDCLYFLADSGDSDTVKLAQCHNFRLVDIRLTLSGSVKDQITPDDCAEVRGFAEEDLPGLRAIARESHRDSRFYQDGNFSDELCNKFFETWIDKSCRGWAKQVFVAGAKGNPEGYITCHLPSSGVGQIGLVAVGSQARGKGLGRKLVRQSLSWFRGHPLEEINVVTQGRNIFAQRLYQRCGFVSKSVELWYHRWFNQRHI